MCAKFSFRSISPEAVHVPAVIYFLCCLTAAHIMPDLSVGCLASSMDESGEKIVYRVSSGGSAEYNDLGVVDLNGRRSKLVTFRTHVFGFDDTERIYVDPEEMLPIRVERNILFLVGSERIVEEYSPRDSALVVRKYSKGKVVKEYSFSAPKPIQNAIILPFSLRDKSDLKIGDSFDVYLPEYFKFTLVSLENVTVPAGSFEAYRFESQPHKFKIWITSDPSRLPVKIVGGCGYNYTMTMRQRVPGRGNK